MIPLICRFAIFSRSRMPAVKLIASRSRWGREADADVVEAVEDSLESSARNDFVADQFLFLQPKKQVRLLPNCRQLPGNTMLGVLSKAALSYCDQLKLRRV